MAVSEIGWRPFGAESYCKGGRELQDVKDDVSPTPEAME